MARHTLACRLWNTSRKFRNPVLTSSKLSIPVNDTPSLALRDSIFPLYRPQAPPILREFSCWHSIEPIGFIRRIKVEGFRSWDEFRDKFEESGSKVVTQNSGGAIRHASTAATEDLKPAEEMADGINVTENCARRIREIKLEDGPEGENKMLRLSVEGGGCSGFLYNFVLDDKVNKDDRVYERDGAKLVVDDISYGFIKGATVDFSEELIRASFAVTINPNAASACGCGASFNAK